MKVIPLSEAKARLSHYGRLCQKEAIVVTVNGSPAFQLVGLDEDDDLIDQLLEHNARFREVLQSRLAERSISVKDAKRRI
jgi:prevent-host-death family protein